MKQHPGVLVLQDPNDLSLKYFPGFLMGAPISFDSTSARKDRGYGEVVFNTSMSGYQEILTDPSYFGQIVCMTSPHIGNTGVNSEDEESAVPCASGFILHQNCERPSSWRSQETLDQYLFKHAIPALSGVDTRALTLYLRTLGVGRGLILPESEVARAPELIADMPPFEGRDLISEVTTKVPYLWKSSDVPKAGTLPVRKYEVVVIDYGLKWNMLRCLNDLGCKIEVLPATSSAEEILQRKPNGVFLTNGPGDPSAAPYAVKTLQGLLGKLPIFGVCMGHQILALALGAKIFKLKFGHRGGNQPVMDLHTRRVQITSQNHGYAVDEKSLPKTAQVTHINLNDRTVEGLEAKSLNAFSVQFHPEASPGPHDAMGLFQKFIDRLEEHRKF